MLGFGGLLVILLVVSGLGIAVLRQHRHALDRFLYENWRSVEYGQNMIEALDRLDDIARQVTAAENRADEQNLVGARASSAPLLATFNKNLADENHNITLPGEGDLAADLTLNWSGNDVKGRKAAESYQATYAALLDAKASPQDRAAAYAALVRLSPQVKRGARAVVQLNLDNMTPIEGRVKAMSDSASRLMVMLVVAGAGLAAVFIAVMGRAILQPLETLTRSAREIEQGNLDLVVQVKSRDEVQQLAEAFNSMAARLREYRRTNRAKLVRTQQTTQNAINSLPDAVAILSPDGHVEMANTAAQRLFGLRPEAHVSELRAEWLARLYNQTSTDLRPIEPRGYESAIQVLDENGSERFFLPHAVPILDDERQLLGVTVVLADVTNLRRLDEMKSGMLSVVSHELKTPMTSIRMGVHLLLEERVGPLTPKQNDLLMAVRDDSDRLNQIVDNLLDMGRIESGRALMDLRPERAEQVAQEATESWKAAFHDRGVELIVEDVPADLPAVMVDHTRIGHVFANLLGNALKYTAPGGQVRVRAEAVEDGSAVRFSVEDTGSGITQDHLPRVFERFFRVPGQKGGTGAGLGLAIAKEIVEAHGGKIGVESTEHVGTKLSFTLRAEQAPGRSTSAAAAAQAQLQEPAQARDQNGDGRPGLPAPAAISVQGLAG
jgi:PAS domain S-box-containing protein